MQNLKLTITYDGTAYVGWQRQANGVSVQECLENALRQIYNKRVIIHGASRTDAGVHALGMIAHFHKPNDRYQLPKLFLSLNALLPPDIRVSRIQQAKSNFHARFSAKSKLYRYRILNGAIGAPFRRNITWHIHKPLDFFAMRKAARFFLGKHNFSSIAVNPGYQRTSMIRRIYRCSVLRRCDEIHIEVEADGFLYKMVRTIVGTLLEVGLHKRTIESVVELLKKRKRSLAGKTAPAHGLFLVRVKY